MSDRSRLPRVCACGEHAFVNLTKGFVAFVDAADLKAANRIWSASVKDGRVYAFAREGGRNGQSVLLARRVLQPEEDQEIVFADNNSLNCRRLNLVLATHAEKSQRNGKRAHSRWPYKGIRFKDGRWMARITAFGKYHHLGSFDTAEAAYAAYCEAGKRLHGEFFRAE